MLGKIKGFCDFRQYWLFLFKLSFHNNILKLVYLECFQVEFLPLLFRFYLWQMDITFWGKFCENGVLLVNFEQRVNEMLCHGTTRSKSQVFNSNICREISVWHCTSNIITQTATLSEILKKKYYMAGQGFMQISTWWFLKMSKHETLVLNIEIEIREFLKAFITMISISSIQHT